jgi:hypothetical protein
LPHEKGPSDTNKRNGSRYPVLRQGNSVSMPNGFAVTAKSPVTNERGLGKGTPLDKPAGRGCEALLGGGVASLCQARPD